MPSISVIIPIYNAEVDLPRCINSILVQTYGNFELILVDDGSQDKSIDICDAYAMLDSRVKVIHKENQGVSSARNVGLDFATGEWIYFIDADDWIEASYLEQFVLGITNETDLLIQSYIVENGNDVCGPTFPDKTIVDAYHVVELLEYTKHTHCGWIWHRLFKREIIQREDIRFSKDTSFGEDEVFFLTYMKYVHNTKILPSKGHHYIIHSNSLTFKVYPMAFYYEMLLKYHDSIMQIDGNWWFNHVFKKKYINKFIDSWFIYLFSKKRYEDDDFEKCFDELRTFVCEQGLHFLPFQSLFAYLYRYTLIFIKNPRMLYKTWWKIKQIQNKLYSLI